MVMSFMFSDELLVLKHEVMKSVMVSIPTNLWSRESHREAALTPLYTRAKNAFFTSSSVSKTTSFADVGMRS